MRRQIFVRRFIRSKTSQVALRAGVIVAIMPLPATVGCLGLRSTKPPSHVHACASDRVLALGACVEPKLAKAICGAWNTLETTGACRPKPTCPEGTARELSSGACAPAGEVRSITSTLALPNDDVLGCGRGAGELVAWRERDGNTLGGLGCLEHGMPPLPCGRGELRLGGDCVLVEQPNHVVDLALWGRAVGGRICEAALLERIARGGPADVRARVALRLPDNDLRAVSLSIAEADDAVAGDMRTASAPAVEIAAGPFLEALRALGRAGGDGGGPGSSTLAYFEGDLRCRSELGRPIALPHRESSGP